MIDVLFRKCEQCEILHAGHSFSIPTEMPGPYEVLSPLVMEQDLKTRDL